MASLKLESLSKVYPNSSVPAVESLDLDCEDGTFLALLGPSGCGKTSTLRMIAGLEPVTSGRLLIGGEVMNDVHPKDRGVGLAFENYALYPPLSVYDNLAFNLRAKGVDRATERRKIERIAELLGITELLKSKPASLSGGQKQRVNIARALVREPKPLLLDEPLSHLDARARLQLRTELKRLHVEVGATTVSSRSRTISSRRWPWPTASPSWTTASCSRSARPTMSTTFPRTSSWRALSASRR